LDNETSTAVLCVAKHVLNKRLINTNVGDVATVGGPFRLARGAGLSSPISKLIRNATPKICQGAPHSMGTTRKHENNEELLTIIKD
jgi:hypothetical protein